MSHVQFGDFEKLIAVGRAFSAPQNPENLVDIGIGLLAYSSIFSLCFIISTVQTMTRILSQGTILLSGKGIFSL